jgi:hypothetical protein
MSVHQQNNLSAPPIWLLAGPAYFGPIICCQGACSVAAFEQNDTVQSFKSATPVGWQKTYPQARKGLWVFPFYEEDCIAH